MALKPRLGPRFKQGDLPSTTFEAVDMERGRFHMYLQPHNHMYIYIYYYMILVS